MKTAAEMAAEFTAYTSDKKNLEGMLSIIDEAFQKAKARHSRSIYYPQNYVYGMPPNTKSPNENERESLFIELRRLGFKITELHGDSQDPREIPTYWEISY